MAVERVKIIPIERELQAENSTGETIPNHTQTEERICPHCGTLTYRGVPVKDMLAYPHKVAAQILGVTSRTIYNLLRKGELHENRARLISRAELERFAATRYGIPRRIRA